MNTDALKDKIYQIITAIGGDLDSTKQSIINLNDLDLLIWLSEQDSALNYQLALELDIPLQHLEHTCKTLKHIHDL